MIFNLSWPLHPSMSTNSLSLVEWSYGDQVYASPVEAESSEFQFSFAVTVDRRPFDLREEVLDACRALDGRRKGSPVALCFSGGIDCEVIAICLSTLGIPFEIYFLDIWGLNANSYIDWVKPLSDKLGKKPNVVSLDRAFFYEEHSLKVFKDFGIELPTYLAMTYLFDQIPKNQFIVVGDGDMHRSGRLFEKLGNKLLNKNLLCKRVIPFSSSSVFYYLWLKKNKSRRGEFYFYSSTPGLIGAMIEHPEFNYNFPFSDTRCAIYSAFPEVAKRSKTTNWDTGHAAKENGWIRSWLCRHVNDFGFSPFWKPGVGALVDLDSIFSAASVTCRKQ